ncbi:MAG: hypothetical protein II896_07115 [Clostridia bacterium]|nr:hypothetical protein [Clostridia bacterium]
MTLAKKLIMVVGSLIIIIVFIGLLGTIATNQTVTADENEFSFYGQYCCSIKAAV